MQHALALVLIFAIGTLAANAPREPLTADESLAYFPTTTGAKWIYDKNGKEETEEVTAVDKKDEDIIVTIRKIDVRGVKTTAEIQVCKEGLFQLTGGPAVQHPPMHLLKLPHRLEQKWKSWLGAWGNGKNTLTAFGPERIEVPAGKFNAIRVETTFPSRFREEGIEAKYWYAAGVGLVKETYDDSVRTLKSFKSGKE